MLIRHLFTATTREDALRTVKRRKLCFNVGKHTLFGRGGPMNPSTIKSITDFRRESAEKRRKSTLNECEPSDSDSVVIFGDLGDMKSSEKIEIDCRTCVSFRVVYGRRWRVNQTCFITHSKNFI